MHERTCFFSSISYSAFFLSSLNRTPIRLYSVSRITTGGRGMMLHSEKSRATSALLVWYISYSSSFLLLLFFIFPSFTPFYHPCHNVFSVFPSRVSDFCRIRPSAMVFVSVSPCFHPFSSFLFSTSSWALIFFSMYSFFAFRIIFLIYVERMWYTPRVSNSTRSGLTVLSYHKWLRF